MATTEKWYIVRQLRVVTKSHMFVYDSVPTSNVWGFPDHINVKLVQCIWGSFGNLMFDIIFFF